MFLLICSPGGSGMLLLICSLGCGYVFVNLFAFKSPNQNRPELLIFVNLSWGLVWHCTSTGVLAFMSISFEYVFKSVKFIMRLHYEFAIDVGICKG